MFISKKENSWKIFLCYCLVRRIDDERDPIRTTHQECQHTESIQLHHNTFPGKIFLEITFFLVIREKVCLLTVTTF